MSRPILYLMLVISILFVLAGAVMVVTGAEGGWPGLLFFGVCAGVFVAQLWPGLAAIGSTPPDPPEVLLKRFPGPVELHASKIRLLVLMVGSAVFGATSLWIVLKDSPSWLMMALVWPGALMFLAGAPVIGWLALRGSSLRLDGEGFRTAAATRKAFIPWRNVGTFSVASTMNRQMVAFDDEAARDGKLARANVALIGRTSALSDSYGLTPSDLAWLMNAWRERALSGTDAGSVGRKTPSGRPWEKFRNA